MEITSVADAVAVLDYLHRRELLCTRCGDRLAVYDNVHHRRCEECVPRNGVGSYNRVRVPSVIEGCIVTALQRWLSEHCPREGGPGTGEAANSDSDR